jgi:hypothetical protein
MLKASAGSMPACATKKLAAMPKPKGMTAAEKSAQQP